MGLFPQQFIDDLRLQANILQVVQEYVPLKRAGTTYKGLCPFHSEKTPSFHVDPDKGFFHCFGCGVGGDVFKFLELHEKVGVPGRGADARAEVRRRAAGADRRERRRRPARRGAARSAAQGARGGGGVLPRAARAPAPARAPGSSSKERGVTPQTIEQLGLGFAPQSRDGLKARLLKQGFPQALLLQSGLVVQRDERRSRRSVPQSSDGADLPRHRLGHRLRRPRRWMPIRCPKYLNSPETPIYSKGRTLYGLNLTKAQIRKLGFAVLVEGYFDFAQVFQSQAAPVVASCGTALTPQQAQLLRRFTSKVVLSFDPDAAGQGAAARSCELLVAEGLRRQRRGARQGRGSGYVHPAEGRRTSIVNDCALRGRISSTCWIRRPRGVDFGHDDSRRQFLGKMLTVAARIPDAAARDQFADRIAHKARITEEVVRAEIRKAAVSRRTAVTARELPSFGQLKQRKRP